MPRIILIGSLILFILIGGVGAVKKLSEKKRTLAQTESAIKAPPAPVVQEVPVRIATPPPAPVAAAPKRATEAVSQDLPQIDRIFQLFTTGPMKLPIVETVTYSSSVPWIKGRPAWIADYASYYQTSRHFIARSLNGKPDYLTQRVSTGSKFNVLKKDKNIQFYLVVDVSRCKMGFYYFDVDTQERVLLKTYNVGLGREDGRLASGTLTPLGIYSLGSRVAIYKPGDTGRFQDQNVEMIRIFGTRWIPFEQEYEGCTDVAKGYGIHGAPWVVDEKTGQLLEDRSSIGTYSGDGCVRLAADDVEEIFSIILTKPSFVILVKDFKDAKLPGTEVATPIK